MTDKQHIEFQTYEGHGLRKRVAEHDRETHAGVRVAGLFLVDTPPDDSAVGLDLGVVWPKIVLAHQALEFADAGVAQRAVDLVARIGCVVVRLDVVDRLLLHLVHGGRIVVRLAWV